jgi:hypothetical protein
MGDYEKKIHPHDNDPYEHVAIPPVERDKKGKEEFSKILQEPSKPQVFATLASFFKKIISFFILRDKEESLLSDLPLLIEHLTAFRAQLQILAQRDESYNPEFTKQLTELWHNLVDDCNSISSAGGSSTKVLIDIKNFINRIEDYPKDADHTLGYYFDAYAGTEWTPFPFMDMLKELHEQHQKKPSHSQLAEWLALLQDILDSLQGSGKN